VVAVGELRIDSHAGTLPWPSSSSVGGSSWWWCSVVVERVREED
jgi:hypothetical protein